MSAATQELFDHRIKARSLAGVFAVGGVIGFLTLAIPHGSDVREWELLVLAGVALAVGALFYLRRDEARELELHAAVATGTVMVTLASYYGGLSTFYPLLYTWAALYAFYFFKRSAALAHIALIGLAYAVLLALERPDGAPVRWLLAVATPLFSGLLISQLWGRLRVAGVNTEERSRRLRQSEARIRLVLDSAPDAFVATDGDGLVVSWNVAAERLLGWPADEAIGQRLGELFLPPEGLDAHEARLLELATKHDPITQMEVELRRRDGTRFLAENTVSRVAMGEDTIFSVFIRDISERQRRQEEREALLYEQAARKEAEHMAEMISGMQTLVDAALAHRGLNDILTDLAPRVRGVLDADAAAIYLTTEGGALLAGAASGGTDPDQQKPIPFGHGFVGRVASERRPMLAEDPSAEDLVDPVLVQLGISSLIGVPLLAEGEVTGAIVVCAAGGRRFAPEDLGLLRLAADRVALAIDHASVYEREHRIAETLQRSLLPERLPQLPGMVVAARYLPAATEAEVGGDWYDVIPITGGAVGLVMGDVAGKGLAAASMVGRLRSAQRAYALEGHDPAVVVQQLNHLLWTELEDSQMATLLYMVIDPGEGTVRWVNAGHLPPLLLTDGAQPTFLEGARSVPLGVLPFPTFEEQSLEMGPGGTILLYTDGLVERPGTHLDRGLEALAEAFGQAPEEPDALCEHVLRTLLPAGAAADDVALLALRNTPMTDRFHLELPTVPEALASMRGLLRRWLRHARCSEQEIAEIIIACGEAGTNAIEHASAGGSKPFDLDGRLEGREVDIVIRDHGEWRKPRVGDKGRGLSLMRALMDQVEVTPSPEGTTVRLRRRLAKPGDE